MKEPYGACFYFGQRCRCPGDFDMAHEASERKFLATPEKGEVSALLVRPEGASHLLVLGHGASTNIRHATLQTIAERLSDAGIATFRYNFPYAEHGKGRDSQAVCTATVRAAVAAAHGAAPDLPLLAGGHSFGGRMASTAASESPLDCVHGLVFFAFPLHQPGKPDTSRADHLGAVAVPMLFLSGSRDELADLGLLRSVCAQLGGRATLHALDTADHGYKFLKRVRRNEEDVFVEMARVVREWAARLSCSPSAHSPSG
jgi:predicted alpha/beta-hydrolase family hydrolase